MVQTVPGVYYDGDFTVPSPVGPVLTEQPFPFQPQTQIYRQKFQQLGSHYSPLAINSPMIGAIDNAGGGGGAWTLRFGPAYDPALGKKKPQIGGTQATTTGVSANATALQVQNALNALASIGGNTIAGVVGFVTVTGDWTNGFVVNFPAAWDVQPTILGNPAGLTPGYTLNVSQINVGNRDHSMQKIVLTPINQQSGGGATGIYLIGESNRVDAGGGGLVEWERSYANIPLAWGDLVSYNYQQQRYQIIRIPWFGTTDIFGRFQGTYRTFIDIAEFAEPLTASVFYSYCLGKDVGKKKGQLYIPFRIIHGRDTFGNEFVHFVGTNGVAEASSAKRWNGDIWEIKNTFVTPYL